MCANDGVYLVVVVVVVLPVVVVVVVVVVLHPLRWRENEIKVMFDPHMQVGYEGLLVSRRSKNVKFLHNHSWSDFLNASH
jgi:hypothetical protein